MDNLDENQKKAVYYKNENCLLVACPGSGKTTVIVNRLNYLINDLKINKEKIVVITFTKNAANSMKERYIKKFGENTARFSTFHSMCYKALRISNENIKLIDGLELKKMVRKWLSEYMYSVSTACVNEYIRNFSHYKATNEIESEINFDIFKKVFFRYEDYKRKNNMMDFDDIQNKFLKLLRDKDELIMKFKDEIQYILVDEFQDCDETQIEILKELKNSIIFAVGDEDQCIYDFRGSTPIYMIRFKEVFNGEKIFLKNNYRSKRDIVKYSEYLIKNNKERNEKSFIASKKEKGNVKFINTLDEFEQSSLIAKKIKERVNSGEEYSDTAILYRSNIESSYITDNFTINNIPFKFSDKSFCFYDHTIIEDLLAYYRLSLDPSNIELFIKIINKPFRYFSNINNEKLIRKGTAKNVFDEVIDMEVIPMYQKKIIYDLKNKINKIKKMDVSKSLDYILGIIGYNEHLKELSKSKMILLDESLRAIAEFRRKIAEYKTVEELVTKILMIKSNIVNQNKNGVCLSTIHGVKGMEYKNVHIINCVEDYMPNINSKDSDIESERRIFYVGMTRSINELYMYAPDFIAGKKQIISRFISDSKLIEKDENKVIDIKEASKSVFLKKYIKLNMK